MFNQKYNKIKTELELKCEANQVLVSEKQVLMSANQVLMSENKELLKKNSELSAKVIEIQQKKIDYTEGLKNVALLLQPKKELEEKYNKYIDTLEHQIKEADYERVELKYRIENPPKFKTGDKISLRRGGDTHLITKYEILRKKEEADQTYSLELHWLYDVMDLKSNKTEQIIQEDLLLKMSISNEPTTFQPVVMQNTPPVIITEPTAPPAIPPVNSEKYLKYLSDTYHKTCKFEKCSKEFWAKRRNQSFCSPKCKNKYSGNKAYKIKNSALFLGMMAWYKSAVKSNSVKDFGLWCFTTPSPFK